MATGSKLARSQSAVKLPEQRSSKSEGLTRFLAQHLRNYFAAVDDPLKIQRLHPQIIEEVERVLIIQCLDIAQGNQLRAARILGLNRNTLRRKIEQLGIDIMKYRE